MIKRTFGDGIFDSVNAIILILLSIITLYPFLYVVFASLSDPIALTGYGGILYKPLGFSLNAYKAALASENVWIGYRNTIFYVLVGTSVNMLMTTLGAYGLSRKNFFWAKPVLKLVLVSMFFSGGLIPNFLLIKSLGLYNSMFAAIIPGAISSWNLFIMKSAFTAIPASLEESAKVDGANDFTILFKIVIPLSMPVIAVMILFYGVAHWNSWFQALMYITNRDLYPLQLFLREILISNNTQSMMLDVNSSDKGSVAETIKYATIMVSTLPILLAYPFLQKYFVKGVLIGAVKG